MQTEFRIEEQKSTSEMTEEFIWMNMRFAVGALVMDIAAGKIRPKESRFPKEFIATFAKTILGVKEGIVSGPAHGLVVAVQYERMLALPEVAFSRPVIMAYVGRRKGVLDLDGTGPHYVLIDGNHRMGRAYLDGREGVDVVILSAAQVRKYRR
ncbi:hypothetical protein AB4Y45_32570 [Paraburkholderia sp. EG287A]|uniref:hypothetical protein n=1 Tax=Paraburkholderia sp. EG287A TaxID=3237012 RepID=UPI0034D20691